MTNRQRLEQLRRQLARRQAAYERNQRMTITARPASRFAYASAATRGRRRLAELAAQVNELERDLERFGPIWADQPTGDTLRAQAERIAHTTHTHTTDTAGRTSCAYCGMELEL